MNKVDKLSKEVLGMVEFSKEVIRKNLVASNENSGFEKLSESQISNVLNIVNVSLSQGIQKAIPVFQKVVNSTLNEVKDEALESSRKKK